MTGDVVLDWLLRALIVVVILGHLLPFAVVVYVVLGGGLPLGLPS